MIDTYGICPYIVSMPKLPAKGERVEFRAPKSDVESWRVAAVAASMTLSDWIRRTCNAATPVTTPKKGSR